MCEKYGYVYITTNNINGMQYIGQHKSNTFEPSYKGSGLKMQEALKQFKPKNFSVKILEWCYNKEELDEREIYWIAYYNAAKSDNFYNISLGGAKTFYYGEFSDAHRKHIGEKSKGRKPSKKGYTAEEYSEWSSQIHSKEYLSEETITKLRESRNRVVQEKGIVFWINNGIEEAIVNEKEYNIKLLESKNWVQGRLPDYVYMTNGIKTIKIHNSKIQEYIEQGYCLGKSDNICNNIKKSRRHYLWKYKDRVFYTSGELADYLRNTEYPEIANSTVVNIGNGQIVKKYIELCPNIKRIPLEDNK